MRDFSKNSFWTKGLLPKKNTLNPSLDPRYKEESVYEKIVTHCGGKELADQLWDAWKLSRNAVFHWFPEEQNAISLNDAGEKIARIIDAMDASFKECNINYDSQK
jgi:hypothetical protein